MKKFLKQYQVELTLIASVPFIALLPRIELLSQNPIISSIIFLTIIGALALFSNAYIDFAITAIISLTLASARIIFNVVDDYSLLFRTSAILSVVFIHVALFIGPWSRFTRFFLDFYKHRRHIGVTAFLLGLTHATMIMKSYFNSSLEQAFLSIFVFFGFTALFIMFWLAITSWDYIQKHISLFWWNIIHGTVLLFYLGFVGLLYKVSGSILKPWQIATIGIFILIWLLSAPWSLPRKILSYVNGWKQLHVLIYIAYGSIIIHVWTGIANQQPIWIKALFWTVVLSVVTSHAIGWLLMLNQYIKQKKLQYETLTKDNTLYYKLDRIESFIPGQGRKFTLGNIHLAVFLHEGEFLAYSNRCAHQGGPIYQGKIVRDYVVCPWHRYAFHRDDGCGPPGFPDCIPIYPTFVQDSFVYTALTPFIRPRRPLKPLTKSIQIE